MAYEPAAIIATLNRTITEIIHPDLEVPGILPDKNNMQQCKL
jgi:hypothetical protein